MPKKKEKKPAAVKPEKISPEKEDYIALAASVKKVQGELESKYNAVQKGGEITGAAVELGRAGGLKEALDLLKTIAV